MVTSEALAGAPHCRLSSRFPESTGKSENPPPNPSLLPGAFQVNLFISYLYMLYIIMAQLNIAKTANIQYPFDSMATQHT